MASDMQAGASVMTMGKPLVNLSAPHCGNVSFEQWTRLTDAYAKQFFLLHRGVRSARGEAMRLAQELTRLNQAMSGSAA